MNSIRNHVSECGMHDQGEVFEEVSIQPSIDLEISCKTD